jgi:guanosine-3',5'-bis(diphosphate) 3'-pyrophosphohydrolase
MPSRDPRPEPYHRYVDAILYAMRKHGGQRRRDGRPYISHPLRVSECLRTTGGITDPEVLIAGMLHDLIEDTECEWANIERRFGSRVADLVAAMTGDMRLPKPERRREIVDRIRDARDDAKSIRLADRLDNLTDMQGFTETRKREYIDESRDILAACRGANSGLEHALENAIDSV